jgi:hypothetical protein
MGILILHTTEEFNSIYEMYERRHLLVHATGRIDEKYRSRFDPQRKLGTTVSVSHDDIEKALDTTLKAALEVARQVKKRWPVELL